ERVSHIQYEMREEFVIRDEASGKIDVGAHSKSSAFHGSIQFQFPCDELPPIDSDHWIPNARLCVCFKSVAQVGFNFYGHSFDTTSERQIVTKFPSTSYIEEIDIGFHGQKWILTICGKSRILSLKKK